MIYEILDSETETEVLNTIKADEDFMLLNFPDGNYRLASIQAPVVTVVEKRQITRLAFMNRFTDAEAVALDLASIGATTQAAMLRRYLSKVQAARYIDLNTTDIQSGVMALEAMGILAAGRSAEILNKPIEPHELPYET